MNETQEIEILKKLMQEGFSVAIKSKYGVKEVISIEEINGLIVTKVYGKIEIIDAPKTFMKRSFVIKPKYRNASMVPSAEEIYEYLAKKQELYYRDRRITKVRLEGRRIVLSTEDGYDIYVIPSDMLESSFYVWGE
jgi:hypothetical protein